MPRVYQTFLAVTYLHQKGIKWMDAKQNNIVIMPDFTIRLIDVGIPLSEEEAERRRAWDHYFTAGMLCSLNVSLLSYPEGAA
jgi:serine/threonine protein kinase